ncbi:uncharacterized protein SPSK_08185 [Sporothrix schenckii 1099-18]|uniref:Uncharacterized protein n=1 Tax=Sporothrix schenckii 1099-18 TaxID=1397361 RepID=A0A0F2MDV0_SPOSC|nr:uncharacterized protein SPSK_08185 [Sporothrix schenckii 1099-18]KJR87822.1 hypothetical protein SPSK_08185 [Sporothrix schenckii 1099-18]
MSSSCRRRKHRGGVITIQTGPHRKARNAAARKAGRLANGLQRLNTIPRMPTPDLSGMGHTTANQASSCLLIARQPREYDVERKSPTSRPCITMR